MTSTRVVTGLLVTMAFCGSPRVAAAQAPFTVGTATAAAGQMAVGAIEVAAGSDADLPATTELGLSRVALEAITNVVRHAHATSGEVILHRREHEIELVVADDGVGISQPYVSGIGITSMRSRVQALGGTFALSAGKANGTRLTARLPIRT